MSQAEGFAHIIYASCGRVNYVLISGVIYQSDIMPFNPKYTITEKILNNLKNINSAREVIEQAHLTPKLEAKLRRRALLRNAHASTALAGNKLSFKQVEMLYSRRNKETKQ